MLQGIGRRRWWIDAVWCFDIPLRLKLAADEDTPCEIVNSVRRAVSPIPVNVQTEVEGREFPEAAAEMSTDRGLSRHAGFNFIHSRIAGIGLTYADALGSVPL